jgi:hypothetical protein
MNALGQSPDFQASRMDSLLQFYKETRERFPGIAEKTDREHLKAGWELCDEYAYMWFHSLADMLNEEMRKQTSVDDAGTVFDFMRDQFLIRTAAVRTCIDVSFVENLFWEVSPEKAHIYWLRMPDLLKSLYLGFHSKPPC